MTLLQYSVGFSNGDSNDAGPPLTRFSEIASVINGNLDTNNINLSMSPTWLGVHIFSGGKLKVGGSGSGVIAFQYENSSNNRTHTVPDAGANDTFVMSSATQTISNKTVVSSYYNNGNSGTGTVTVNWATANVQKITATGNFTIAFSNPGNFERLLLIIKQDGTGSRTVTWPTTIRWLNGTGATDSTTDKPTLTTTANKEDVFSFYYDSDESLYKGAAVGFKGAIT